MQDHGQKLLWESMRPYKAPAKMPKLRPWNTIEQTADYFQTSPNTVRAWIEDGSLVAIKKGQTVRIAKQSIRMFVHHNRSTKGDYDAFAARRAAIAEVQAALRQNLVETIPDARSRKRAAAKIWREISPIIRERRDEL